MSPRAARVSPEAPLAQPYHLLRCALEHFGREPQELSAQEYQEALARAARTADLEDRVLASAEAEALVISEQALDEACATVVARYPDPESWLADLARHGLNPELLREALQRELRFNAVMQQVAARAEPVSDVTVQLYFEMNREQFRRPARRELRHILITINPAYPENTAVAARERLLGIHARATAQPQLFAELARAYSECPSAMEGGLIGTVQPGQLYPALDEALAGLAVGAISDLVESELGFHILKCEAIHPAVDLSYAEAAPAIRQKLVQKQQRSAQKAWLAATEQRETRSM